MLSFDLLVYISWLGDMVGCSLGIFFNFLLLVIALTVADRHIRAYSRMLIATAVYDLLFCVVEILTQHQIIMTDGVFVMLPRGIERIFGFDYLRLFLSPHIFLIIAQMGAIPVQFHYKYQLLTQPTTSTKPLLINLSIGAIIALITSQMGVAAVVVTMSKHPVEYYRRRIEPVWLTEGNRTYFYLNSLDNTVSTVYAVFGGLITTLSWIITVIYMRKIIKFTSQSSTELSQKTRDLQRQFNRVLMIQAANGFLFSFLPVSVLTHCNLMRIDFQAAGLFAMLPLSWLPVMNSFVTILVVRSFRDCLLRRVLRCVRAAAGGAAVASADANSVSKPAAAS